MDLFPYSPRPFQEEIVSSISSSVSSSGHMVMESGTGTGKTICSLVGCLEAALEKGKKVIYLTRTNSQQRQVILELRKINEKKDIFGCGIQGRQGTCPLIKRDPELAHGTPEELSRLCGEKKKRTTDGKEGGCRFYQATISTEFSSIEEHCRKELPTVEEFVDYCDKRGLCPYELIKDMLPDVTIVTAPYAFFFIPFIRNNLLDWLNVPIKDVVIIVDEAHNLPDYAREIKTVQMSKRMLELVVKEVDEYGDPEVMKGGSIMDMTYVLRNLLDKAVKEYVIEDDGLIPPDFLQEGLMEKFTTTSAALTSAARSMMAHGESIRGSKRKQGKLPRSYIHSLGAFLQFWMDMDEEHYVKLVTAGDNPALEAYCLDPSLATYPLLDAYATLHMSGTLVPLNEYRASIGMPQDSKAMVFPSPFPKENRQVLFVDDVTTKYEEMIKDEEMVRRMEDHTSSLCNALDRNTVVFFPSYNLMDRFLDDGILNRIHKSSYIERRKMTQSDLMDVVTQFKIFEKGGSVLFAVMGGRISEGIDFPDRELEVAIIAGIPYPKPTAKQRALLHYYEVKFGKGWEYTVKAPVTRKLLQAIGRLIRTETDIGVSVILDRRASQFSDRLDITCTETCVNDTLRFFKNRTG